ncbi:MAG: THUMP domain-containing class I SAM-dependent RNA methyltransferase [Burkholderiaceae bacterium]
MAAPLHAVFAVCPAGLEPALEDELRAQPGITEVSSGRGGVWCRADALAIARANLWCRIPTRLLLSLDQFRLRSPDDILEAASHIAWESFFDVSQTIRVDANQGRKPLFKLPLSLAALKTKDGICDRFRQETGERPSVNTQTPDQRIWLFVDGDKATLSLDTSGEPLFKRGWRLSKGEAPLRENLAAALIHFARKSQDPGAPEGSAKALRLLDPFCGSGTLVIEALQAQLGLAPGWHPSAPRSFACEKFNRSSAFQKVPWAALRREIESRWQMLEGARGRTLVSDLVESVQGSDIDAGMIKTSIANAHRALPSTVSTRIQWSCRDALDCTPAQGGGLLLTNPPYGERLSMQSDWRELSAWLKSACTGWTAWLLTDNPKLDSLLRLKASRRIPVYNGDLDCRWMRFDMVAGSVRTKTVTDAVAPSPLSPPFVPSSPVSSPPDTPNE